MHTLISCLCLFVQVWCRGGARWRQCGAARAAGKTGLLSGRQKYNVLAYLVKLVDVGYVLELYWLCTRPYIFPTFVEADNDSSK